MENHFFSLRAGGNLTFRYHKLFDKWLFDIVLGMTDATVKSEELRGHAF